MRRKITRDGGECPELSKIEFYCMEPKPRDEREAFCRKYGWKEEDIVEMVMEPSLTKYSVVVPHLVLKVPVGEPW